MDAAKWDAIVIGGGSAGLSAAQMLGRARRRTLVIDGGAPRNRFASHMHGVLGHDGMVPADLLARGRAEIAAYGVEVRPGTVTRVEEGHDHSVVVLADGTVETARAVIVATGVADDLPAIPGLAERWGSGVLHCPYCHGWEVRDRTLGVLLTSELGLHQAQLVRQWSDDVIVFTGLIGPIGPEVERRLRARHVEIVGERVVEVLGDDDRVTGVRLQDDRVIGLGALFTAATMRPLDGFLAHLDLERAQTPLGAFLAVDAMGRTSAERIYAAGNVVNPTANVPLSMGAGAMVGAAVNAALVEQDAEAALHPDGTLPSVAPADYWEHRYADAHQMWSGRPNQTVVDIVLPLEPGRALDLGCGEGADAIWLAHRGWDAVGLDISPTAVDRARRAAAASGAASQNPRFIAADLSDWSDDDDYDLVTASFLHSPVALDRIAVLRAAAARVRPGGRLLVVSHAAPPPWAAPEHVRDHVFVQPAEEVALLALDPDEWTVEVAEIRARETTAPGGDRATLDDGVVLLRRSR